MFILDLDDVLLDTERYKEARIAALTKLGVPRETYNETYQQAYYGYTHQRHAQYLREAGFAYDEVLTALDNCLQEVGQFIFPDTHKFLTFLKSYGEPVILLSMGVAAIQEFKVDAMDIRKYFDRIYTTVEPKEKVLATMEPAAPADAWFFEDKVKTTLSVKQLFPKFHCVLKQGAHIPAVDYAASGLPYFKTLTEIKQYVAEHHQ